MRKLLGGVVLVAGVGGLGWYGNGNNAMAMQTHVTQQAATVATNFEFHVETVVSGRDIIAAGVVPDQAEYDALLTALENVEGRRTVDMSTVIIVPLADPFEMIATRLDDGTTTLSGAIGNDEDRALIATQAGDLANNLVESFGHPDGEWAGVGANGLTGLGMLKSGEMILSGRMMTLTGRAASPTQRDAALAAIGVLPAGYALDDQIDVEDDGTSTSHAYP